MIHTFETDLELIRYLEDYNVEWEDSWEILIRFYSPQPHSMQGAHIYHLEGDLCIELEKNKFKFLLSEAKEDENFKWKIEI